MQTENKVTAMLKSDIKFTVRLIGEDESHAVNIQSVNAYFINKDLRKQAEEEKKHFKFLRRYPIEPCVNNLKSTICCLNNPGIYGYNARPVGTCAPVYAGFGVEPFGKNRRFVPSSLEVIKAPVYYTADRSVVEIYFPAFAQKKCGEYDLVINATVYDSGFHFTNGRVMSLSYEGIVTLTEEANTIPGGLSNVEITTENIGTIITPTPDPGTDPIEGDRYTRSGAVLYGTNPNTGVQGTNLVLDLANTDASDDVYIDMSSIADWYEGG